MRKVQSFINTFIQFGILKSTGEFIIIQQKLEIDDLRNMNGIFHVFGDKTLAFGYTPIDRYVFYDNILISLTENYQIIYHRIDYKLCNLKFIDNECVVLNIDYNQIQYGLVNRIGYTEDEVDYNFGLWLYTKYKKAI